MAPYDKQTWADGPGGGTPITAARLNHMEEGIETATEEGSGGGSTVSVDADGTVTVDGTSVELATDSQLSSALGPYLSEAEAAAIYTTDSEVTVLAAAADDASALRQAFGSRLGEPNAVWKEGVVTSPELWTLANFQTGYNSTDLTPNLTANGTNQSVRTRISGLNQSTNQDYCYRFEADYNITVTSGWASITARLGDPGGTQMAGSEVQYLATANNGANSGKIIFEMMVPFSYAMLEIRIETYNNAPSGVVELTNVSLKAITHVQRPSEIAITPLNAASDITVWQQHRDPIDRRWYNVQQSFTKDGDAGPYCPTYIYGALTDDVFQSGTPDPDFLRSGGDVTKDPRSTSQGGITQTMLRAGNNDQIWMVETPGGPFNGYDLYGNVHNGEFPRVGTTPTVEIDRGSGFVTYTPVAIRNPTRRVKFTMPTEMRMKNDASVFAHIDRTITLFPDGMARIDRTSTFTVTKRLSTMFEWMSSHESGSTPLYARMGSGNLVLTDVDFHAKVAAPVPSVSTSGSGGTLPAATNSYRVTSITAMGESLPSAAVTVASTGSTSSNTVSWSLVANATGYRIYGRTGGVERLLGTVGPTATSYVDTGASIPGDVAPPKYSTARRLGVPVSTNIAEVSGIASWSAQYEPRSGWVYGNIYDAESILSRALVKGIRSRQYNGKNYMNAIWDNPDPGGDLEYGSKVIPSGTVWTATNWTFVYRPENRELWHQELAVRASSVSALKDLYPAT